MAADKGDLGEVNGSVDLISLFKLSAQYNYFCRNPLPSLSKSHYLAGVAGDPEISNEGRWLNDLITGEKETVQIQPFDADLLMEAFRFKEAAPSENGKEENKAGDGDIKKRLKIKIKKST